MARKSKEADKRASIAAMNRHLEERIAPLIRFDRDSRVDGFRMARVAERNRDRLVTKAYQTLGIDLAGVEKLHRREQATARRRAQARLKEVRAFANARARERRATAATMVRRWRDVWPPAGGPEVVLLSQAHAIQVTTIGPVVFGGQPKMDWIILKRVMGPPARNALQGWGNVQAGLREGGLIGLLIDVHFVWPSTRAGSLTARGWIVSDLTYMLGTEHSCRLGQRSGEIKMEAWLSLGQLAGSQFLTTTSPHADLLQKKVTESGIGDPTTGPVVETPLLSEVVEPDPPGFPIVAGSPVVVTVSIYLALSAVAGYANAYFQAPAEINVPWVWLNIE
jgi:hypothetical protein